MYSLFYILISFAGIFFIFNKKNNLYYQNKNLFFLINILLLFFLFNNISADKSYYEIIFLRDYFLGFQKQGFDLFFYYFAHLISIFSKIKIANYILYFSFIYSLYFFSKKFRNPLHIILMFFPYTLIVIMQGFPRQAWALMFIVIACNLMFYLNQDNKYKNINRSLLKIYIFLIFLASVFFHYSAIVFLGIYIFWLLLDLKLRNFILLIIFLFINFIILYNLNIFDIYFQKLKHIQDFFSTRDNYSHKGFVSRLIMILIPSFFIVVFYFKNLNNRKIIFDSIDNFFLICSVLYILSMFIILKNPNMILIIDRLNSYFFLITIYFFGRFIFSPFIKTSLEKILILISLFYLNFYLILWTVYSDSYYEFKYVFKLF